MPPLAPEGGMERFALSEAKPRPPLAPRWGVAYNYKLQEKSSIT